MRMLFVRPVILLACILLAACSGVTPRPELDAGPDAGALFAFESSNELALPGDGDDRLLRSQVEAGSAGERLNYTASYSLRSGMLAQGLSGDPDGDPTVPAELGRQSLHQQLHLALPSSPDAPLSINLQGQQDLRWTFNGEARTESRLAHLEWKPWAFAFDLRWTPPREMVLAGQPLDCQVQADLSLPYSPVVTSVPTAISLSGRDCQVRAPARGVDDLQLQSQGLAWRWGEDLNNTLRARRLLPQWQAYGLPEVEPGYELGLIHRRTFSDWELGLDMAWRQFDRGLARDAHAQPSNWAVDLVLRRELGLFALSARWLYANDPLWFVPLASPVEQERLSVLIDFSQWLVERLPHIKANMSAAWDYVEDARGVDDNQFNWNLLLSW